MPRPLKGTTGPPPMLHGKWLRRTSSPPRKPEGKGPLPKRQGPKRRSPPPKATQSRKATLGKGERQTLSQGAQAKLGPPLGGKKGADPKDNSRFTRRKPGSLVVRGVRREVRVPSTHGEEELCRIHLEKLLDIYDPLLPGSPEALKISPWESGSPSVRFPPPGSKIRRKVMRSRSFALGYARQTLCVALNPEEFETFRGQVFLKKARTRCPHPGCTWYFWNSHRIPIGFARWIVGHHYRTFGLSRSPADALRFPRLTFLQTICGSARKQLPDTTWKVSKRGERGYRGPGGKTIFPSRPRRSVTFSEKVSEIVPPKPPTPPPLREEKKRGEAPLSRSGRLLEAIRSIQESSDDSGTEFNLAEFRKGFLTQAELEEENRLGGWQPAPQRTRPRTSKARGKPKQG